MAAADEAAEGLGEIGALELVELGLDADDGGVNLEQGAVDGGGDVAGAGLGGDAAGALLPSCWPSPNSQGEGWRLTLEGSRVAPGQLQLDPGVVVIATLIFFDSNPGAVICNEYFPAITEPPGQRQTESKSLSVHDIVPFTGPVNVT